MHYLANETILFLKCDWIYTVCEVMFALHGGYGELPHPTLRIKGSESDSLSGKTIVLGVTGSVAAVKCVELARELIRHGADVHAVMSSAATKIIHPYSLQYATGQDVMVELTGGIEHVGLMGIDGAADLFLIAPCTANTIGKIASGIDDTSVTTLATTALGSGIKVMIVPAMHESMYNHPILKQNIETLRDIGVLFVDPFMNEGKAKIADVNDIVLHVERTLSPGLLHGKKVVITSGATVERVDSIRIITNRSSGRTGVELARECFRQGADVTVVHRASVDVHGINDVFAETVSEMTDAVLKETGEGCDVFMCAAAISDYTVEGHEGKIASNSEDTSLILLPTRKLISEVREQHPDLCIVGFKAETNVSKDELIKSAKSLKDKCKLQLVVANDVGETGMGTEENRVYIISDTEEDYIEGSKQSIAKHIVKAVSELGP